ncbi:uncharacterized protein LOC127853052 [Dreissena polymorpha]|uniref:Uncharacterized protein n=1 Tax=Dreissena polymorpha TaxID=45954 RepID=A0A9D4HR05_DREPO|nr:uncharacterized protein LOC127853052 [Dreissena polymorpha]KAH3727810.1 hypothetical protein DPMN_053755 [Dreissena polymorpha]
MDVKELVCWSCVGICSLLLIICGGSAQVHRISYCRDQPFFTTGCSSDIDNPALIIHNVTYGYSNISSTNCTDPLEDVCEEPMSSIQLQNEFQKLSSMPSYPANQIPQTTAPKHCAGFTRQQPAMMIYYLECVPYSSIARDMCTEGSVTGPRVSVMNDNYPGQRDRAPYHLCKCEIFGPESEVVVEKLGSRLNCSDQHLTQNLTLYGHNESQLYTWECDTFVFGQTFNLSGSNWTLVWNGHINGPFGNFWIGFKAKDNTNITISCRPIPDPTTTTSTTTTATTTTTITTTHITATILHNGTQQRDTDGSLHVNATPTGNSHVVTTEMQDQTTTSLWLYVGGGACGLVVLIVVISVVVCVRRRGQPQIIELDSIKLPPEIIPETTGSRIEPKIPRHPDKRSGGHRSASEVGNIVEHRRSSTSKQHDEASSSKRRSDSIELKTKDERVKHRREYANDSHVTKQDGYDPPRRSEKRTKRQRSTEEKGTHKEREDQMPGTSSRPAESVSNPRSDPSARDNQVKRDKRSHRK